MKEWLICASGIITLMSGLMVVLSSNAIYSAIGLLFSLFGLSAMYLLWGSAFLSVIQILIYAGAIVVLFVFVVMLLDMSRVIQTGKGPGWFATLVVTGTGWIFSLFLLRAMNRGTFAVAHSHKALGSLSTVSKILFREYLWPFEVLSVFLLAVIIAAYCLARPEDRDQSGSDGILIRTPGRGPGKGGRA